MGKAPSRAVTVTLPLHVAPQLTLAWVTVWLVIPELLLITTFVLEIHPLPSVILTMYTPAHNPETLLPVWLLLHTREYVGVPPVGVTETAPLQASQPGWVITGVKVTGAGELMVAGITPKHPLASVIVTE